ncbi:hypothetical protein B0T21DRAFT_101419 [Apiosordaria backusii]|uniref:Uncharacterized protein n=1 Tax=Apiosordaria backusii TaxID=314023 RepID=A0AA40K487_9PEZI|nr:hypothetical protein B0T21DRAFT_101419 [Apiosordaria backusii]
MEEVILRFGMKHAYGSRYQAFWAEGFRATGTFCFGFSFWVFGLNILGSVGDIFLYFYFVCFISFSFYTQVSCLLFLSVMFSMFDAYDSVGLRQARPSCYFLLNSCSGAATRSIGGYCYSRRIWRDSGSLSLPLSQR